MDKHFVEVINNNSSSSTVRCRKKSARKRWSEKWNKVIHHSWESGRTRSNTVAVRIRAQSRNEIHLLVDRRGSCRTCFCTVHQRVVLPPITVEFISQTSVCIFIKILLSCAFNHIIAIIIKKNCMPRAPEVLSANAHCIVTSLILR